MPRRRQPGFTLIEIMIALGIAAMLMALGLPAFKDFLANSKIRNAAENLQSFLNQARSEAINRNQPVQFLLFADTDYDASQVALATANTTGPNVLIRVLNPTSGAYTHVDWKNGYEGSGSASAAPATTVTATYQPMALGGVADTITVKGLGGTLLGGQAIFDIANTGAGACHTTGTPSPIRCLRVTVSVSGQIRMCDPSVAAGDPRAC